MTIPPAPRVGVVITTHAHERLTLLNAAIDSVLDGTRKPDRLLVVVDHNPDLYEIVRNTRGGDVEIVANSVVRGLGAARNTGVAHLDDVNVIAFLDDDAVAVRTWLEEITGPFSNLGVWGVGGLAHPTWETARPAWFPPSFDWVIGCSWEGSPSGETEIRNPIGCSMAFRREAFELVRGFRDDMGRLGANPLGCEETEFAIRLKQLRPGTSIRLAPGALVTQAVPRERATRRYFLRRCWAEGRSKAAMVSTTGTTSGLAEERRHLIRLLLGVLRDLILLRPQRALFTIAGTATTIAAYLRYRFTVPVVPVPSTGSNDERSEISAAKEHCQRCRQARCTTGHKSAPAPTVCLVIPTRNEAQNLPWVLTRVPDIVTEVVIVDGDSTDDTVDVARGLRPDARIITQPAPGKGAAIAAGLDAATTDVVVMIDADGSMDPYEIPALVGALIAGADVVKSSRRMSGAGSEDLSRIRSLGNWGLSKLANALYRRRWSELNYGYAAFHTDILDQLGVRDLVNPTPPEPRGAARLSIRLSGWGKRRKVRYGHGFEIETLLFTRAVRAGLRVTEVASYEYERRHGTSNLSTWRDGLRVLTAMLHEVDWKRRGAPQARSSEEGSL